MNHLRELASWYVAIGSGIAFAESFLIIGSALTNDFDARNDKWLFCILPFNAAMCAATWPSFPYYIAFPGQHTLALSKKPFTTESIFNRVDDAYLNSKALYMPTLFKMMTYAIIYKRFYEYSPFTPGIGSKINHYRVQFCDINYIA
jgi:hypothetical protein